MACGFETITKEFTNPFELDFVHYLSTLGYSWDAMLRLSDFNLRLISIIGKHQFIGSTFRGYITMTFKEYAEASNKISIWYYAKKCSSYIIYVDANNLYEHSMMKLVPTQIPDRANPKDFSLNNYSNDSWLECFL